MKSLLYLAVIGSLLPSAQQNATKVETARGTVTITPVEGDAFVVTRQDAPLPQGVRPVKVPAWMDADELVFAGGDYTVRLDRHTGAVAFINLAGDTLLYEGAPDKFSAASGTGFYGAGERGHALRLNGDSLIQWNRPNYGYGEGDPRISQMGITMPYLLSDRGFGILFNDASESSIAFEGNSRKASSFIYDTKNPSPVSYTFIGGGSMPAVTDNYTRVAGRQGLPPFWALGYITSKYGYHTDKEALGAVDSLKQAGYPVDGLIFDLYWYGKETDMGKLAWNREQFPDPKGMLDSLNRQGVNTVLIHQPYINLTGAIDQYNMLKDKGLLTVDSAGNPVHPELWIGWSGMFDMANPATREWLWNRLDSLTRDGVYGWWGDLGEPEKHPLNIRHANGLDAADYHNIYGNDWSRLIYEGMRRDYPDRRPFLMMRGGSTGLQKYSVFPWTGDVARSWAGLQPQVKLMLSSGLSGLGYMSSDIGGFAVDESAPRNPELYLRWMQLGVFSPVLRTHAQQMPEPYHYPEYAKELLDLVRMRYQWLPYNYTLAYENAAKGQPLVRPLNYYGDTAGNASDVTDEYLWGRDVLVAPVMTPGAKSRKVIFPTLGASGADTPMWVDWFNPSRRYKGATEATVPVTLDKFPLYVRAGSFIPQYTRPIDNVSDYRPISLTVEYFPSDRPSSYEMYEDDRTSPTALEDGKYALIEFRSNGRGEITITPRGSYLGMTPERHIDLQVVRATGVTTHQLTLYDKPITIKI